MNRIRLRFRVAPDQLASRTYVPRAVRLVITDPDSIFITGILGESGRRMVSRGFVFEFEKTLANRLIRMKVARREGGSR